MVSLGRDTHVSVYVLSDVLSVKAFQNTTGLKDRRNRLVPASFYDESHGKNSDEVSGQ